VIGVNAQIESSSSGNEGVGFAVPSNTAEAMIAELLGAAL
jgi:S1-C subfamily serine protease